MLVPSEQMSHGIIDVIDKAYRTIRLHDHAGCCTRLQPSASLLPIPLGADDRCGGSLLVDDAHIENRITLVFGHEIHQPHQLCPVLEIIGTIKERRYRPSPVIAANGLAGALSGIRRVPARIEIDTQIRLNPIMKDEKTSLNQIFIRHRQTLSIYLTTVII